MKQKLLKTWSLLILAVLIGAVSVQAQTLGAYEADIPFDFTVENQKFEAGNYLIKVKSPNYLATILTVSNEKGRELLATAVRMHGDRSGTDTTQLLFARYGERYVLKQIAAPRFGFETRRYKEVIKVWIEEDIEPATDTVSVLLKKRE